MMVITTYYQYGGGGGDNSNGDDDNSSDNGEGNEGGGGNSSNVGVRGSSGCGDNGSSKVKIVKMNSTSLVNMVSLLSNFIFIQF